ncbi:MAG: LysM peptidoglycan-binding domain-containing protein [Anaerolineaceae bacterium]|nr:LysM peptidoglycan-binding domain-containing protein [Anaerolineaceae bacterium]
MLTGELVKATITNLDTNQSVDCLFNPSEYTFSKSNNWAMSKTRGANVPKLEFNGGNPTDLKMELFFDTYESAEDVRRKYTNGLWELARVNSQKKDPRTHKSRPPMCEFRWGSTWSFKAVVVNISQKFTMFLSDGTPVRATVEISLRQVEDEGIYPNQNPTSGGIAGYRTHVVREGELLDWIASQEYGESKYWRYIADINGIGDPMRIKPGTVLSLPPLP